MHASSTIVILVEVIYRLDRVVVGSLKKISLKLPSINYSDGIASHTDVSDDSGLGDRPKYCYL